MEELIKMIHEHMRELTLMADVPEEIYNLPIQGHLNARVYSWISEIHEGPFAKVSEYWSLHPPERWAMYEGLDPWQLREYQLLQGAFRELRKAWKKPYHEPKESAKSSKKLCVQPKNEHPHEDCP